MLFFKTDYFLNFCFKVKINLQNEIKNIISTSQEVIRQRQHFFVNLSVQLLANI